MTFTPKLAVFFVVLTLTICCPTSSVWLIIVSAISFLCSRVFAVFVTEPSPPLLRVFQNERKLKTSVKMFALIFILNLL